MITVDEALKSVFSHSVSLGTEPRAVRESAGYVLSESVTAPINMPPFRQSAMDGYALTLGTQPNYRVVSEIKAGDSAMPDLGSGHAARIFTGAAVPDTADTVVAQEHVRREGSEIFIEKMPPRFANVRPMGEQIKRHEVAMKANTLLNEASIGFLLTLGVTKVWVYKKPKIGILVTGNELVAPGSPLPFGCVYESNSAMLEAALRRFAQTDISIRQVGDHLPDVAAAIRLLLAETDVLLVCGGISVGDYDFVRAAFLENGIGEIFYQVSQKPAKPLWFGTKAPKLIFGLPGNPASALTCFYVYVLPALQKMAGYADFQLPRVYLKTTHPVSNDSGRTLFLQARAISGTVQVCHGQSSARLDIFSESNCLAIVPPHQAIPEGEKVACIWFG